jgi:hypothetical protein
MAFGQIDPARLNGDALRRWYMRSPADIEQERQQAAAQRYEDFFGDSGGADAGREPPVNSPHIDPGVNPGFETPTEHADPEFTSVPPGNQGLRSVSTPAERPASWEVGYDPSALVVGTAGKGSYQLAAASSSLWDYLSPGGCANCHGYRPGTLPPVGGQSPLPPSYSPRTGGGGNGGGGGGSSRSVPRREWSDKPQCNQQFNNDRKICQRAHNYLCWENQMKRLATCNETDLIGIPQLGFGPPGR